MKKPNEAGNDEDGEQKRLVETRKLKLAARATVKMKDNKKNGNDDKVTKKMIKNGDDKVNQISDYEIKMKMTGRMIKKDL